MGLLWRNLACAAEIRVKHVILIDFPSVDDDIESEQFCELSPTEQVERVNEVDGTEGKPLRSSRKMQVTDGPRRGKVRLWRGPTALVGRAAIEHKPKLVVLLGNAENPNRRKPAAPKDNQAKVPETTNQAKHSSAIILQNRIGI